MRRLLLVSMLLLITSCTQKASIANRDIIPLNEVFEHSERCPHLCWLSIKPGATTMEEATTLLLASDQIDHESIQNTEYGIAVKWYKGATNSSYTWVRIYASDNGIDVKSIIIGRLFPYTVKDIIDFLGEPDEIFIVIRNAPHGRYLDYALHYPSLNTFFYTGNRGKIIGPDPDDYIENMYLDTNLDDENLEPWIIIDNGNRQPWLGYGHLDEYLPNVKLPDSQ